MQSIITKQYLIRWTVAEGDLWYLNRARMACLVINPNEGLMSDGELYAEDDISEHIELLEHAKDNLRVSIAEHPTIVCRNGKGDVIALSSYFKDTKTATESLPKARQAFQEMIDHLIRIEDEQERDMAVSDSYDRFKRQQHGEGK